jgi:RimJ/RimL family protein N-acetyltransferase
VPQLVGDRTRGQPRLVDAAIDQMNGRWPAAEQAVAAAVRLDNGQILTSVGLDNLNAAATLCAETGALCQAYTLNPFYWGAGFADGGTWPSVSVHIS